MFILFYFIFIAAAFNNFSVRCVFVAFFQAVIKACARKRLTELTIHNLKKKTENNNRLLKSKQEEMFVNKMATTGMDVLTGVAQIGRDAKSRVKLENGPTSSAGALQGRNQLQTSRFNPDISRTSFINKMMRRTDKPEKSHSTPQMNNNIPSVRFTADITEESSETHAICTSIDESEDSDTMEQQPLLSSTSVNKNSPRLGDVKKEYFSFNGGKRTEITAELDKRSPNKVVTVSTPQPSPFNPPASSETANKETNRSFHDHVLFPQVYYNQDDLFLNRNRLLAPDPDDIRRRSNSSGSSIPRRIISNTQRRWSSVKDRLSQKDKSKGSPLPRRSLDDSDVQVLEQSGRSLNMSANERAQNSRCFVYDLLLVYKIASCFLFIL